MKKLVSLLFAFVLLFSSFFLISCSNSDVELKITHENYKNYLNINVTYSDYQFTQNHIDSINNIYYDKLCMGTYNVLPKIDGKFQVTVFTKPEVIGWTLYTSLMFYLDKDGCGTATFSLYQLNTTYLDFPSSTIVSRFVNVEEISGKIITKKSNIHKDDIKDIKYV